MPPKNMMNTLVVSLLVVAGAGFALSARAGSTVASVTRLDDSYEIHILTDEQSFIPFHPDKGFFPRLRRQVNFVTTGPGSITIMEGAPYRRFTLKYDIFPVLDNCLYVSGEVLFSEERRELIVKARLSERHSHYKNHSGKYQQVKFADGHIEPLSKDLDLTNPTLDYVRANGIFLDHRSFLADGKRYEINDWRPPKDGKPVALLARVYRPGAGNGTPYLSTLRRDGWPNDRCHCPRGASANCQAEKTD